jgi:hypothetical protein
MARPTLPKDAVHLLVEIGLAVGTVVIVMMLAATLIGAHAEPAITEWPGCPPCIGNFKLAIIIFCTLSAGSCIGLVAAALFASAGRNDR